MAGKRLHQETERETHKESKNAIVITCQSKSLLPSIASSILDDPNGTAAEFDFSPISTFRLAARRA